MYKMPLVELLLLTLTKQIIDVHWVWDLSHVYLDLGYLFLGHLATTKQHKQEHSSAQHLNVLAACFST